MSSPLQAISNARGAAPRPQAARREYVELKANVHKKLLNRLNLEALAQADRTRAENEIRTLVIQLVNEEGTAISLGERDTLFNELIDEVFGLGPLDPLLRDPTISDILVNTYKHVFVERQGKLDRVATTFQDDRHLMRVIDRIVSGVARRVDAASPMVDARLPDGSRVNAIIPPLALKGPTLTIRKFSRDPYTMNDLISFGSISPKAAQFLAACVKGKLNILISGGTGTGKTTTLNAMSAFIPGDERIVTIEDAAELQLQQEHVITLQDVFIAKPPDEDQASTGVGVRLLSPLACTGLKPNFLEKMAANGVLLQPSFFSKDDTEAPVMGQGHQASKFKGAFQ